MNSSRDRTSPTSTLVAKITLYLGKVEGGKPYAQMRYLLWTLKKFSLSKVHFQIYTSTSKLKNSSSFKVQMPLVFARYARIPA